MKPFVSKARIIKGMLGVCPLSAWPSPWWWSRVCRCSALVLLVWLVHTQLATPSEAHQARERGTAVKPVGRWVCNAYGLTGGWQTVTGSPRPTKVAALASVMKDCQRSLFACRTSGCWPQ